MVSITLPLTLALMAQGYPNVDARTVFSLLERYHASFQDIAFIYEGTRVMMGEMAKKRGVSVPVYRFQGYYAYRNDGATVLDVFGYSRSDRPVARTVFSILKGRLEIFNASPDFLPPVRARAPETARGGAGSLDRPDSPERIFLAWYFPALGDPAEHDVELQGWEEIDGHRCLKLRMLKQPKPLLKGWPGGLPYVKLWIDCERDGYPLRYELYRGDDLEIRGEISRLERLDIPKGGSIWLPAEGTISTFVGGRARSGIIHTKEPLSVGSHKILIPTVKFNQGLRDNFFSSKKHALVANDEGLRDLQARAREDAAAGRQGSTRRSSEPKKAAR